MADPHRRPAVLGLDVGRRTIRADAYSADLGERFDRRVEPTSAPGQDPLQVIVRLIAESSAAAADRGFRVATVGLAVPGAVDTGRGYVRSAPGLGWRDLPLAALVGAVTEPGTRVGLIGDVVANAVAEHRIGAGAGIRDLLFVSLGTTVGSVHLVDGRPASGAPPVDSPAHVVVDPAGERCACGRRGCVEVYASGWGVTTRYAARTGHRLSPAETWARVGHDPVAAQVWDDAALAVGRGLAVVAASRHPRLIVLGGGIARSGPRFARKVRDHMVAASSGHPPPSLALARLGGGGVGLGAVIVALAGVYAPAPAPPAQRPTTASPSARVFAPDPPRSGK